MNKDYYNILGIDKKASKEEIKKAYRKLAHKFHPDKTNGDADKFKEASEAYSVLSDEKKRAEYDTYGRIFSGSGPAGAGGASAGAQGFDFGGFDFSNFSQGAEINFGDIFGDIFGGQGTRTRRGRDISIDIEISFSESIFGVERKVLITKNAKCGVCGGEGAEHGSQLKTCAKCSGKGVIHDTKKTFFGTFTQQTVCSDCNGSGKVPEKPCKTCRGVGITRSQEEITVRIPSGIENGEMVRLSGAGEAIHRGTSGDLYIKVHVRRDPNFTKEGANIVTSLPVKITDALLGSSYSVKTLDGVVSVKIPAGITHGELLRIRGKGVPIEGSRRGDLLIKITITLPTRISRKAKRLLDELREEGV